MPFISSSEAKNAYFMRGEATNEKYIFLASRDEINGIIHDKTLNFLIIYNLKCG